MESLKEWEFEFSVAAAEPIPHQMMVDLLCLEAIPWAEKHKLGIGGGFRHGSKQGTNPDRLWLFNFGLCIQQVDLLIPRLQAQELFNIIAAWCQVHGFKINGGFREYPPAEVGLSD